MMGNSSAELIRERLKEIRFQIEDTCVKCGRRPEDVTLMAVTKTVPAELVNVAVAEGITLLGENRAQELLEKFDTYTLPAEQIHFIGHLQTNKVRQVIDKVGMIESVDSLRLATEIERCAAARGKVMEVLLEVNIAAEPSKNGVLPGELDYLLEGIAGMPHLKIRGIMVIPPAAEGPRYFELAQKLLIDIQGKKLDNRNVNILSMGMSFDYREAIRFGSNIVRIGRGLFGERH